MAKFTCNFISRVLKHTVDLTVVVPSMTIPESIALSGGLKGPQGRQLTGFGTPKYTNYVGKPRFPVLYLFHGMGNNHATWTGYTNAELYAEERNLALVMLSAENKSYINTASGDRYFDFIQEELMDFVCGMFPVSQRREDTFLAGLSMGGYGALVHSLNRPERYGGVGVFSAAIDLNPFLLCREENLPLPPEYQPRELLRRAKETKPSLPPYYFACGELDDSFEANRAFMEEFRETGTPVTWSQLPGYAHEWRFWDRELELFMDWLPRTDTYAQEGRRRV